MILPRRDIPIGVSLCSKKVGKTQSLFRSHRKRCGMTDPAEPRGTAELELLSQAFDV